jgi:GNAT superfamily N-acetyltransferase
MRLSNIFTKSDETDITIRKAEISDSTILQGICDAWIERGFFEGETLPTDYIEQCLTKGDLPPISDAKFENYSLFVINDIHGIIGLFDLYDGYPQKDTAWISLLLLDVESRGNGLGKMLVEEIVRECKEVGFKYLALASSMNNRVALKFWVNNGFKEIIGLYGDLKYPIMGLKRLL